MAGAACLSACTLVSLDDLERGTGGASTASSTSTSAASGSGASITTGSAAATTSSASSASSSTGGSTHPYVDAVEASQPLAYYRFEDAPDSLIVADETAGHDASWNGTRNRRIPGAIEGDASFGIHFDGDSFVRLPDAFEFAGLVPFSIELWFRVPQVTQLQFLLGNETSDPDRRGYTIVTFNDANVGFERWGVTMGGDNVSAGAVMSPNAIAPNTWYHFVATWDGNQHAVYLDGVAGMPFAPPDPLPLPDNGDPAILGASGDTSTKYDGDVDELAIYDRALDADEVAAHFAAASSTN